MLLMHIVRLARTPGLRCSLAPLPHLPPEPDSPSRQRCVSPGNAGDTKSPAREASGSLPGLFPSRFAPLFLILYSFYLVLLIPWFAFPSFPMPHTNPFTPLLFTHFSFVFSLYLLYFCHSGTGLPFSPLLFSFFSSSLWLLPFHLLYFPLPSCPLFLFLTLPSLSLPSFSLPFPFPLFFLQAFRLLPIPSPRAWRRRKKVAAQEASMLFLIKITFSCKSDEHTTPNAFDYTSRSVRLFILIHTEFFHFQRLY